MSSDLALDPSDPLNLLLHNTDEHPDSAAPSPHWALWNNTPNSDLLDYTPSTTDHFSMNVDMHSFGIEPNMLHFDDPTKYHHDLQYPYFSSCSPGDVMMTNHFPFTFQAALDQVQQESPSSSSSSSSSSICSRSPSIASTSPHLPHRPSIPSSPGTAPSAQEDQNNSKPPPPVPPSALQITQDAAEKLAQRVRQTAGVMLAVPMTAHMPGHTAPTVPAIPSTPVQTKLPIPRLPRQNSRTQAKAPSPGVSSYASSSAASTPPPSTPPLPSSAPGTDHRSPTSSTIQMQINLSPGDNMAQSTAQVSSRPKTSHTTIERRYRTNLNARIQSLRMAVPALRVLEDRDSSDGKKIKRAVKGGIMVKGLPGATGIVTPGEDGAVIDVIDERGYVDGVKVARKCSKANVLGKAVEYIKVLKRREHRLRAEHAGLKALVGGLVGGPALLHEWEKEWRDQFGGEERDELDADELANNEAEDEDSDEDEEDEDGETGRKRKRGKVASSANINGAAKKAEKDRKAQQQSPASATGAADNVLPDAPIKRKRGRPRKVQPPIPVVPASSVNIPSQQSSPASQDVNMLVSPQQEPYQNTAGAPSSQPQQYLLATFALFSFFNSPLTSSYSDARQSNDHQPRRPGVVLNHPPLVYAPEIVAGLASAAVYPAPQVSSVPAWGFGEYAQAFQLAVSVLVLFSMVMSWLKVGVAPHGHKSWLSSMLRRLKVLGIKESGPDGHKNSDWLKVGGQMVLKDSSSRSKTASLYTCIQVSRAVRAAKPSASLGDLCTQSLVLHGAGSSIVNTLLRARSRAVWNQAKTLCASLLRKPGKYVHVYERLVLDSMNLDEAAGRLCGVIPAQLGLDMDQTPSPLKVLGGIVVRDRMKKYLADAFVKTAAAHGAEANKLLTAEEVAAADDGDDDDDRQKTFSAAAELGGSLAQLGEIAERLCRLVADGSGRVVTVSPDLVESLASSEEEEVASLILALVLYQRVFHSREKGEWTLSSPPPSPGRRPVSDLVFLLKKTLGSCVFEEECVPGLEDARDDAVDLVVDIERKRRQ